MSFKTCQSLTGEVEATQDDAIPESKDSRETAQDMAEEGNEEKGALASKVISSWPFAFGSFPSDFDAETGYYQGTVPEVTCQLCGSTAANPDEAEWSTESLSWKGWLPASYEHPSLLPAST